MTGDLSGVNARCAVTAGIDRSTHIITLKIQLGEK